MIEKDRTSRYHKSHERDHFRSQDKYSIILRKACNLRIEKIQLDVLTLRWMADTMKECSGVMESPSPIEGA